MALSLDYIALRILDHVLTSWCARWKTFLKSSPPGCAILSSYWLTTTVTAPLRPAQCLQLLHQGCVLIGRSNSYCRLLSRIHSIRLTNHTTCHRIVHLPPELFKFFNFFKVCVRMNFFTLRISMNEFLSMNEPLFTLRFP